MTLMSNKTWSSVSNSSLSKTFASLEGLSSEALFSLSKHCFGSGKKNESKNYFGPEENFGPEKNLRPKKKILQSGICPAPSVLCQCTGPLPHSYIIYKAFN